MRHHFLHPQAMFNEGSPLFYSHCCSVYTYPSSGGWIIILKFCHFSIKWTNEQTVIIEWGASRLGSLAGPAIQATGRWEFKDGSRQIPTVFSNYRNQMKKIIGGLPCWILIVVEFKFQNGIFLVLWSAQYQTWISRSQRSQENSFLFVAFEIFENSFYAKMEEVEAGTWEDFVELSLRQYFDALLLRSPPQKFPFLSLFFQNFLRQKSTKIKSSNFGNIL
jgi:hypothetical protein